MLRLNIRGRERYSEDCQIQIQPMLRLNETAYLMPALLTYHSNTTNVKVKLALFVYAVLISHYSNTTNVKVKRGKNIFRYCFQSEIQIQPMLRLN